MGTFKKRGVCSRGIMRLVLLVLIITGQAAWAQSLQDLRRSYFVPLPEEQLLESMRAISANTRPKTPVTSVTSLTVGTGGTVIYWDQWEDGGYDADSYNPGNVYSASNPQGTQIWGDSNLANGCPPLKNGAVNPCAVPTDDFFQGGDVVFTRNEVPIHGRSAPFRREARDDCRLWPNNARLSDHCFDGRDKISATYPLVVSRSGWASGSNSLLAGAVEVPTTFQPAAPADDGFLRAGGRLEVPVGTDTQNDQSIFEYSALYVMAGEGGASGTAAGTSFSLGPGEGRLISNVQEGASVSLSSGSTQVHLVTGDIRSSYETRWYLLYPIAAWATEYITPVGSTTANAGCTQLFVYNPSTGPDPLTVTYTDGSGASSSFDVPRGASARSPRIPSGYGARVSAATPFYALSVTDCNGGEIYDWGHALVPAPELTTSVEVGWAPGCTTSNCGRSGQATTRDSRSPLWITAESGPTTVYVDFDGQGAGCTQDGQPTGRARAIPLNALQAVKVTDDPPADPNIGSQGDYSMTGARVFTCDGTEISVAWGQDPALSGNSDQEGLDLGGDVPPLGSKLRCDVRADKTTIPVGGDTSVTYTFRVFNDGETGLGPNILLLNSFTSPPPPDQPTGCLSPAYVRGDSDGQGGPRDDILQPDEVWEYTCTVNVPIVPSQPPYVPVISAASAFSTNPFLISNPCSWEVVPEDVNFDFGDTPGSYGGPGHRILTSPALYLGGPPDADPGLQNAAPDQTNALGDDNNGATPDDEDGVVIQVLPGGAIAATVTVVNTTGSDATLCGWLDGGVDGIVNGVFTASEGRCITSAAATETLTWSPPIAPLGAYARFRVTTDPLGVSDGGVTEANDGEVEDYRVEFLDFGDAPDGYGTTLASGGARHVVTPDLFLGSEVDSEPDGQPRDDAKGDDNNGATPAPGDEDGVTFRSPGGTNNSIFADVVVMNATGSPVTVCAWLDVPIANGFDAADAADGGLCQTTSTSGTLTFQWSGLPADQSYATFARFRVSSDVTAAESPTGGPAPDGEVEDYQVQFDFTPTAVTIGSVDLDAMTVKEFLAALGVDGLDTEALLALLSVWDPAAAAALQAADREAFLAALRRYLDPDGDGQLAVLRWETLEQRGTVGFYVDRDEDGGDPVRINGDMLPALIGAPLGGEYLLADPSAGAGVLYQYTLIEQEAQGTTRTYGPFSLELSP
jgi:hypothetical protein